jgi:GNAT superfamily N-acetyltransferase
MPATTQRTASVSPLGAVDRAGGPAIATQRPAIRPLERSDLAAIVAIDAIHSGAAKPAFWAATVERALRASAEAPRRAATAEPSGAGIRAAGSAASTIGFVAVAAGELVGYVFAEARAWEFGSPLCGWITAIGVRPDRSRQGVAHALGREVCQWLRSRGIGSVRTMVRRDAVEVLAFFRAAGFRAGPYLEMELDL